MKLCVDLKNCRGVSKFDETFDFDRRENIKKEKDRRQRKAYVLYAPNGTMKTSFARTLEDISKEQETKDYIYPERETERKVYWETKAGKKTAVKPQDILVINSYDESYKPKSIDKLIADENLQKEYDIYMQEIEEMEKKLEREIKVYSGNKQKLLELARSDFGKEDKFISDFLQDLFENIKKNTANINLKKIKYDELINNSLESLFKDQQGQELLEYINEYMEKYEVLIEDSDIFTKDFHHNNAEDIMKQLDRDGFFKAEHKIIFKNGESASSMTKLKEIINNEYNKIIENNLKYEFEKIDEILSRKKDHKNLRDLIAENKWLIPELADYDELKKNLWKSYFIAVDEVFEDYIRLVQENTPLLNQIKERAKEEESRWEAVTKKFNARFKTMPFKAKIVNKEKVKLGKAAPKIVFEYHDRGDIKKINDDKLNDYLSMGEKRALYLLKVLYDIELKIEQGRKTLLVLDDIADSFDYRNKYSIIEYLNDIVEEDIFYTIILTHNFDFYRIVCSRLDAKDGARFIIKNEDNFEMKKGEYFENVFNYWKGKLNEKIIFLASITFARNIVEMLKGTNDIVYKELTKLLHHKKGCDKTKGTKEITVGDLVEIYEEILDLDKEKLKHTNGNNKMINLEKDEEKPVYDLLFEEVDEIIKDDRNHYEIEYKVVLAIGIRLKAEEYMISKIRDKSLLDKGQGNQTRYLKNMLKGELESEIEQILERVLIMTPEHIHLNSFMYEPILDMNIGELKELYKEVEKKLVLNTY